MEVGFGSLCIVTTALFGFLNQDIKILLLSNVVAGALSSFYISILSLCAKNDNTKHLAWPSMANQPQGILPLHLTKLS